ncbi:MAG: helix-turn-helix domain-containing protein [Candidatus Woesearchaeota archaeon]
MNTSVLKEIGLTDSEAKVYLALLSIGKPAAKKDILREARTAPSKVYDVLDKLAQKGLVSMVIRNGVKHFIAAPPSRIRDYLDAKQESIAEQKIQAEKFLPLLEKAYGKRENDVSAEVFVGWKGLETAYAVLRNVPRGKSALVIGASQGADPERTRRFYFKQARQAYKSGIRVKVLFAETARGYVAEMEKSLGRKFFRRFIKSPAPTEVLVAEDSVAIVMLKKEPLVILIRDKETADSFRSYFDGLWKTARE